MRTPLGPLLLVLLAIGLAVPAAAAKRSHHVRHKHHARAHTASAASPTHRLGAAHSWTAYTYRDKTGRVCYLIGEPRKVEPTHTRHQQPMVMVTHRPQEHVTNVVSLVENYPLKDGSNVSLDIDGTKFEMFTKGDSAWSRTADLDRTIVDAMMKGKEAVVKGTPKEGKPTTDTYSLVGFSRALKLIDKACKVKR